MDVRLFSRMLADGNSADYEKLRHKYPGDFGEFLRTLADLYYVEVPLPDSGGRNIVFTEGMAGADQEAVKALLRFQGNVYGLKAAEDEIVSTASIESIDLSRDSVRSILKGNAPGNEQEDRILGMKRGMEFIADPANAISEENLHSLYQMTVGAFLPPEDRLEPGSLYRGGEVFVVGDRVEHAGLDHRSVPGCMKALVAFANAEDGMNDLAKAAVLHFYIGYVHPYFDGNGRMARLVHLWFLLRKGYRSTLFVPFSSRIEKTRKAYYDAYSVIERNRRLSGVVDVTPFIRYFAEHVYRGMGGESVKRGVLELYDAAVRDGKVTGKEAELWKFVLSCYGTGEFSTKRLERDFGGAAYGTIRTFVLKFEGLGLLTSARYGPRVRYRVVA